MTDNYRDVDIPIYRLSRPYAKQLEAQVERLDAQLDALSERVDKVHDDAQPALDALAAKVPEWGDETPTAVQHLTHRLADADLEVAVHTRDVAAAEARVKYVKAVADRDNLNLRLAQVDHLAEAGDPVLSPGNDDELAIWTLVAQESAMELATAEACLQSTRRRLEHAKKVQREVREALRAQKRAEEKAAKK
ncbi:hypothetical protein JNW88_23515 [Micromonospora sp. ATA32]|nr:hypothetical protein [Micromonospora sp. ATA32]